ncbi:DNA-binding protein [Synechococcus sp. KORDI-52]|uniref:DNA-processing protein DprA n=1 Tax=Synechococcus sp. KORDI-52 TaxID=585425 RepID=UPI0004E0511C|nr:DNA-protecting protein DprA [Synechococcus sp. KORDI-52]AII47593.1 DNA-binding protein [Synechococcus sp. KORDI-52]
MADLRRFCRDQAIGPDQLWAWPIERLGKALGWPARCLRAVDRYRCEQGIEPNLDVPACALLPGDPAWPSCLDGVDSSPSGLYVEGDRLLLRRLNAREAIAVVGTRSASDHGLAMAEDLGRALAEAGWPVLSGLAEGIDAAAHHGCLISNGSPIAILGTPLDRVYPAHHRSLQQQVAEQGLLVSTTRSGSRVYPGHFATRNRWLVTFAKALVVVECPQRSGALISARWASRMHCPVWVVPGDARRWSCRGSNALLRDRATALIHSEDLVRCLGDGPLKPDDSHGMNQQLMGAIGAGASVDQLVLRLQCSPAELASELLALECKGELLCESGLHWRKRRP